MGEKFGELVRRLREARDLGLRELARKAGISPSYLSMIEAGTADPPTVDKLEGLAAALGTDRDLLVVAAGRIPTDVEKAIQADPQKVLWLLRQTKDTSVDALKKALKGNSESGPKE